MVDVCGPLKKEMPACFVCKCCKQKKQAKEGLQDSSPMSEFSVELKPQVAAGQSLAFDLGAASHFPGADLKACLLPWLLQLFLQRHLLEQLIVIARMLAVHRS